MRGFESRLLSVIATCYTADMDRHKAKIGRISDRVREFYDKGEGFRVYHGSTNSTRVLTFYKNQIIDVSDCDEILEIDAKKRLAVVEPNVPMDKLVRSTLKKGLLPKVAMEFPGITVGGGIQGNGGESSSFKYGSFNQTAVAYEIVAGDGTIHQVSDRVESDLFYGIPGTAGTLGVLTSATLSLIPAKKYVELSYKTVTSFAEAQKVIATETAKADNDFIDGIMFSSASGVVIAGKLTNLRSDRFVRFKRAHDQWYYLHVEQELAKNYEGWTETTPIYDYLFRYDRGAFWVGRYAFELFDVPYTRLMRWVLNPILHTRKLYQALQESGQSQHHIVQDLVMPSESFVAFGDYLDKNFGVYPLWLCPMQADTKSIFQLNNIDAESIINVGVWSAQIPDHEQFIQKNQQLERKVIELGGRKWSYAYSYFTEKDFWQMYDKSSYEVLRKRYHSQNLPTIYDKITVKKQDYTPVNRRKAVFKTIFGIARLKMK